MWRLLLTPIFLVGTNVSINEPTVRFTEVQPNGNVRVYNAEDRSSYDVFKPNGKYKRTVRYSGPSHDKIVTTYKPGISYQPGKQGVSSVKHTVNGAAVDQGTIFWSTQQVDNMIMVQSTTFWEDGNVTLWYELYTFDDERLLGSEGGNGSTFQWDIAFEERKSD